MRRLGRLARFAATLAMTLTAVLSCGRQVPTQPVAELSTLQLGAQVWREGDIRAYSIEGRPDALAIRFDRMAFCDPESGDLRFLTYAQAVAQLSDDAMVTVVSVWRIVPGAVGVSPEALRDIRIADVEWPLAMQFPNTDPLPPEGSVPPPSPCGPDCPCGEDGNISMGCLKCCYSQ